MSNSTNSTTNLLTLDELELGDIDALLAEDNSKGRYMKLIKNLVDSGDIYIIVDMPGTEPSAIKQSLKLNLKKCVEKDSSFPELVIKQVNDATLLINKSAHEVAKAAAAQAK